MTTSPSPLALAIATSLMERWSIGVSSSCGDEADWDSATAEEVAAAIDQELAPTRAALKDLALAAAFCAEHRDRRTEVVQPFMGFEEHTVIHDLGPTEDAARCQVAIDKARPVLEAFKLYLNQPPPIAPHSTIIR